MKAGEALFRFRFLAHAVVYTLGFAAPWTWRDRGPGTSSWLVLAGEMGREGWISFSAATVAVLIVGILCALVAAMLRTWGTAYLGGAVVNDHAMQSGRVVADGPYRYMRNPLYLGTWVHTFALAMLMVPSGAVFSIVAVGVLQLLLIRGEEGFLAGKLGAGYAEYLAAVPRIFPALRARVAAGGVRPQWGQALIAEIYFWGVAVSFAVAGWRYNAHLLMQCVLVSLGVSLVARALAMKSAPPPIE